MVNSNQSLKQPSHLKMDNGWGETSFSANTVPYLGKAVEEEKNKISIPVKSLSQTK